MHLHPNLLRDPNVVQDPRIVGGYQLGDNWYQPQAQPEFVQTPQAQEAVGAVSVSVAEAPTNQARTDTDEARLEAARQRRQRAREREEERPGLSALLPASHDTAQTALGGPHLLPARIDLVGAESALQSKTGREYRLQAGLFPKNFH